MTGSQARLVVLISGSGSNLQAVLDACDAGSLPARVVLVVSNRPEAFGLERARRHGVAADCLTLASVKSDGGSREDFDRELAARVAAAHPDLIALAGFMHILSPAFLERFDAGTVVNLHPSLLPENPEDDVLILEDGTSCRVFRGHDAPRQALAAKVPRTGTSVHFVTAAVDRGPVIAQQAIPVLPDDSVETLQNRIQAAEHVLLPQAIGKVLQERGFGSADGGVAHSAPSRR